MEVVRGDPFMEHYGADMSWKDKTLRITAEGVEHVLKPHKCFGGPVATVNAVQARRALRKGGWVVDFS